MPDSLPHIDPILLENLKTFVHLTTQAPLESVCKSALYLLTRVPSTRNAVIEYIGTFYKVATFLHLRFNLNQKNPNYPDINTDLKNIIHINEVIDLVEQTLIELMGKSENKEIWTVELCKWLVELIGDIVQNTGVTFADTVNLSVDEASVFKSPNISEGLETWNNQCRSTQSILYLIQKCITFSPTSTQLVLIDLILNASTKYNMFYDWILCYLSPFEPELLFQKLLISGFKDYQSLAQLDFQHQLKHKFSRVNVFNFYSLNFSNLVNDEIIKFLYNSNDDKRLFILRLASQTPALLVLLIDKILDDYNDEDLIKSEFYKIINSNEDLFIPELFNCVKQINNNVAIFDIFTSVLEWLIYQDYSNQNPSLKKYQNIIISFLDEMIANVYLSKSQTLDQEGQNTSQELCSFLKNLNNINGYSFKMLTKKIISIINSFNKEIFQSNQDLIYKLVLLISINGDTIYSNELISELLIVSIPINNDTSNASVDNFINKLRQEMNPFHSDLFKNSIKSVIQSLKNTKNEQHLLAFLKNLSSFYEWDLQNQYFICQNLCNILNDKHCLIGLLDQLSLNENCTILILEIYNKVFKADDYDLEPLKLNIDDLIQCSNKLINFFFDLINEINEENIQYRINALSELIDLIDYILKRQFNASEDCNPIRNIFLRNSIDKIFETIQAKKIQKDDLENIDMFDENANLFNKNIDLINNEILSNKSRLKAVRNSLLEFPLNKPVSHRLLTSFKCIKNFAFMDIIQIICSSSSSKSNSETKLLNEQMCNLADLIVYKILLNQHYVDYQWSSSNLGELDDNLENELDAMKLYIERDMNVQKTIENPVDNQILWFLLEFIADHEQAIIKLGPLIRSLLSSIIIQWESFQDQSTRNNPKILGITIRLLNLINRSPNLLPKPYCFIVDIIPLINSYETHILLLIIWKKLKKKMNQPTKQSQNPAILNELNKNNEMNILRYIFQKNIGKLAYLYSKFFQSK